jgi:predicted dithiol-disulfide oxidoreductase (DUF899 family)
MIMGYHKVVSHEEWIAAGRQLLVEEKESLASGIV